MCQDTFHDKLAAIHRSFRATWKENVHRRSLHRECALLEFLVVVGD